MKRTLLLGAFSAAAWPLLAQLSVGGTPVALRADLDRTGIPTVHPAPFDADKVAREDAQRERDHKVMAYARNLELNVSLADAGAWTELPNGDRVWRLRITSEGALATELFFEDFFLPSGAQLYLYDEKDEQLLGGFTAANNRASGLFTTTLINGPTCIVEYDEPAAVSGQGHFRISRVGHAYREVGAALEGACQVDVNCPEGANWTAQRDGVVRISVTEGDVSGWCSGALVNNVEQDCRPFILTADHCGSNATSGDLASWRFYFNFERPACGSGDAFANHAITGCLSRGSSNDNGGDSGSDFLLVELDQSIPDAWHPYWCGWDATSPASTGGVGIHHPEGAAKKISTFTGTTTSSSFGSVPNTHWRITWAATATAHGVTEGGSSGSPLFNNAHRIIGTLSGGGSCCTNNGCGFGTGPTFPDYYGKMSYHWQSNAGPIGERLKAWLDPNNTGTLTMDGSYGPCGTLGVNDTDTPATAPGLYPNPANDVLTILYPAEVSTAERIDVLDVTGRVVRSITPLTTGKAQLDLSGWSAGTYFVRLMVEGRPFSTARFEVMHP